MKKKPIIDLDVDFIGGEELTPEQEQIIRNYFDSKNKTKNTALRKAKLQKTKQIM